jgi:hypothetical protein
MKIPPITKYVALSALVVAVAAHVLAVQSSSSVIWMESRVVKASPENLSTCMLEAVNKVPGAMVQSSSDIAGLTLNIAMTLPESVRSANSALGHLQAKDGGEVVASVTSQNRPAAAVRDALSKTLDALAAAATDTCQR